MSSVPSAPRNKFDRLMNILKNSWRKGTPQSLPGENYTPFKEKIRLGKPSHLAPDMSAAGYKMFDLESRRYIGNKAKLTDWIMNIINEHTGGFTSFFDVFAGPASVS